MAGDGDDTIYTGSGNDKVEAGSGDDLIIGGEGAGDDNYDGGLGVDTIKYTSAIDDLFIDLRKGIAVSRNGSDKAGIGSDKLAKIENVIGGYFNDLLIGDLADNILDGEKGDDIIQGGAGEDTAIYRGKKSEYVITRQEGGWIEIVDQVKQRDGVDKLFEIEKVQFSNRKVDLNGIFDIAYSTIHKAGSVAFQKDSGTGFYAVSVNGGNPIEITIKGEQIHEGIYGGWETLAAADIGGVNTVLWKNTDANRLHTWRLDSNWNLQVGMIGLIPIPSLALPLRPTSTLISMMMEPSAVLTALSTKLVASPSRKTLALVFMPSQSMVEIQLKSPSKENRSMKASTAAGKPSLLQTLVE